MQKHDARRLHYDFRLELGGVFLSWAVPKGPSLDPEVKRLAMQTEDHPLDYGDFEGIIPEGEYGAGTVLVWDRGSWQPEGDPEEMYRRGRLTFELHGQKLRGRFHLVRTPASGSGKKDDRRWLLFKSRDAVSRPGSDAELLEASPLSVASGRDLDEIASDPDHVWTSRASAASRPATPRRHPAPGAGGVADALSSLAGQELARRAPLPAFIEPELATLVAEAPAGDEWLHEIKLDGYRILARLEERHARLFSRRGHDWTARLPSIASALGQIEVASAWLDGEVVVLGEDGVSNFQMLQNSMEAGRDVACVYFMFDVPFLDGFDLRRAPLEQRKALLEQLVRGAGHDRLRFSDHVRGKGPAFFEQACALGLEGIISKRADAAYESGRGRRWLKVKCLSRREFVIGGYTEPAGTCGHLGALLLGVPGEGGLVYAGKVGTGFTRASLSEIARRLAPLEQPQSPFVNPPRGAERSGVHWVAPRLVAEVAFVERTQDGLVRHASFQGLRDDKAPAEVGLEEVSDAGSAGAPAGTARATRKAAAGTLRAPKRPAAKRPAATQRDSARPTTPVELDVSRIEITNPDRVLFPDPGITKRELMIYYARVAHWMLPHVIERPLMLVRCPEGEGQDCFHQKRPSKGMPRAVEQVQVPQKKGPVPNLVIRDVEGLFGLVQMGALEIHTWGCRVGRLEHPDQLVFDLDPDEGLPWERVVDAARALRERLDRQHGLTGFLRVTGGKGLHVVVPVTPSVAWDAAKQFAKSVADAMVQAEPTRYLATMTKQKRRGKIFIDYFRNGRGATAVCSYSTRARAGASVAAPIGWDELDGSLRPDQFDVRNIEQRLKSYRDPWASFEDARAPILTS